MIYTTVENKTELIWVEILLYILIMLKPILLPIFSKPDLVSHLLILKSTNKGGRKGYILSHTQLLLVGVIICPKW